MKKLLATFLLFALPSWAAEFSGTITKVSTRTFSVAKGDRKMIFKLEGGTQVVVDGQHASPAKLQVGQRVTVQYELQEGEAVAHRVEAETSRDKERKENKP